MKAKKIIVYMMIIVMMISRLAVIQVSAQELDKKNHTITSETTLTVNPYYPDWFIARFYDKLWIGEFHKAVQADIRKNNPNVEKKSILSLELVELTL